MKKMFAIAVVTGLVSTSALAADNGFYMGVQAGYGNTGYSASDITASPASVSTWLNENLVNNNNINNPYDIQTATLAPTSMTNTSNSSNNYAGRLFVGYQFNPYFAIESGYTQFSENLSATSTYNNAGQVGTGNIFDSANDYTYYNTTGTVVVSHQITENAIDADLKFIYPIANTHFNVYTKIGAAYVNPELSTNLKNVTVNAQGAKSNEINVSTSYGGDVSMGSSICPVITPGVSYDITNNLSADASWMVIIGEGTVKTANFASLGLTYHF